MMAQARSVTDAPEALRDLAKEGAAQARENLETMSAAAGEATDFLKHSFATTVKGTQDYKQRFSNSRTPTSKSRLSRRQN